MSESPDRPSNAPAAEVTPEVADVNVAANTRLSEVANQPIVTASLTPIDTSTANTLPSVSLVAGLGGITQTDAATPLERQPFSQNRFVNYTYGFYRGAVNTLKGTITTISNPAALLGHTVGGVTAAGDAIWNYDRTINNITTAAQNADAEQWGNFTGTAATALGLGFVGTRAPNAVALNRARINVPQAEILPLRANLPVASRIIPQELSTAAPTVTRVIPQELSAINPAISPAINPALARIPAATGENLLARANTLGTGTLATELRTGALAAEANTLRLGGAQPFNHVIGNQNFSLSAPVTGRLATTIDRSALNITGEAHILSRPLSLRMELPTTTVRLAETVSPSTVGRIVRTGENLIDDVATPLTMRGPVFRQEITGLSPRLFTASENMVPRVVTGLSDDLARSLPVVPPYRLTYSPGGMLAGEVRATNFRPWTVLDDFRPTHLADNLAATPRPFVPTAIAPIENTIVSNSRALPFARLHQPPGVIAPMVQTSDDIAAALSTRISGLNNVPYFAQRDLQRFSNLAHSLAEAPRKSAVMAQMETLAPRVRPYITDAHEIVQNLHIAESAAAIQPVRVATNLTTFNRGAALTASQTREVQYFSTVAANTTKVPNLLEQAATQVSTNPRLAGHVSEIQEISRSIATGGNVNDAISGLSRISSKIGRGTVNELDDAVRLLTEQRAMGTQIAQGVYDRVQTQLTQLNQASSLLRRNTRGQIAAGLEQDVLRMRHLAQNTELALVNPGGIMRHTLNIQEHLLAHQRVLNPYTFRSHAAMGGIASFAGRESYLTYSELDPIEQNERRLFNQRSQYRIDASLPAGPQRQGVQEIRSALTGQQDTQAESQTYFRIGSIPNYHNNIHRNAFRSETEDENAGNFNMAWMQYAHFRQRTDAGSIETGSKFSLNPENNHYIHMVSSRNIFERTAFSQFSFSSPVSQFARLDSRYVAAPELSTRTVSSSITSNSVLSSNLRAAAPMRTSQGMTLAALENVSRTTGSTYSSPLSANVSSLSSTVTGITSLPFPGSYSNQITAGHQISGGLPSLASVPIIQADPQSQMTSSQNV